MSLVLSAADWAVEHFGQVQLGDKRRAARAVAVAGAMAADPSGSIPRQNKQWKQTKGAYRLFDAAQATFESMIDPHHQHTRRAAGECGVVLMIQDTTHLNYTSHPGCEGLGRFAAGSQRWESGLGLLLHNVLAVEPLGDGQGRVLGLAHNKRWARTKPAADKRSTHKQRHEQGCESDRWVQAVEAIGAPPPGGRYVHVGDREADIFPLYQRCKSQAGVSFVVRVSQLKRAAVAGHPTHLAKVKADDRPTTTLGEVVRSMPASGAKRVWVAPRGGRVGRWAKCQVSGGAVTIYSPWGRSRSGHPLCCFAVRVWEINAPAGVEPLEWLLLSDEPVNDLSDALRLCQWYALRWTIEQYHQCLKSGCKVESRQLEHVDRLGPLIGMLCVVAVRLLQLRNNTRRTPQAKAIEQVPPELVTTLAKLLGLQAQTMTLRQFAHELAKRGGFVGRNSDGEPGWLSLWRGWHELELITLGTRLPNDERRCG